MRRTCPVSIWNWLKDSGNQRTLKFIGGGIAVALALIVQTELSRKQNDAAGQTPSAAPAATPPSAVAPLSPAPPAQPSVVVSPPAPQAATAAPIVQVITGPGATANAVQGNNIEINIHGDKH